MSTPDSIERLERVIDSGPDGVRAWLRQLRDGQVEEGFNSLGLAEAAAHLARRNLSMEWAAAAVELYEELARRASGAERGSLLLSAMHLRAFFINRFGHSTGDPVLDLETLVDWFLSSTPLSLERASSQAHSWPQLDIEEIRALRAIKNRLAVFEGLERLGLVDPYPQIKEWLTLRERLP